MGLLARWVAWSPDGKQIAYPEFQPGAALGGINLFDLNSGKLQTLTFADKSYLTLKIGNKYYSNNPYGAKIGPGGAAQPVDVPLLSGQSWQTGDTVRTRWPQSGFDIVQDIYIRRVEKINGELWNTEFAKFPDVKDPLKVKK